MTLDNACSNVFETTELLENILSHLPSQNIFVL